MASLHSLALHSTLFLTDGKMEDEEKKYDDENASAASSMDQIGNGASAEGVSSSNSSKPRSAHKLLQRRLSKHGGANLKRRFSSGNLADLGSKEEAGTTASLAKSNADTSEPVDLPAPTTESFGVEPGPKENSRARRKLTPDKRERMLKLNQLRSNSATKSGAMEPEPLIAHSESSRVAPTVKRERMNRVHLYRSKSATKTQVDASEDAIHVIDNTPRKEESQTRSVSTPRGFQRVHQGRARSTYESSKVVTKIIAQNDSTSKVPPRSESAPKAHPEQPIGNPETRVPRFLQDKVARMRQSDCFRRRLASGGSADSESIKTDDVTISSSKDVEATSSRESETLSKSDLFLLGGHEDDLMAAQLASLEDQLRFPTNSSLDTRAQNEKTLQEKGQSKLARRNRIKQKPAFRRQPLSPSPSLPVLNAEPSVSNQTKSQTIEDKGASASASPLRGESHSPLPRFNRLKQKTAYRLMTRSPSPNPSQPKEKVSSGELEKPETRVSDDSLSKEQDMDEEKLAESASSSLALGGSLVQPLSEFTDLKPRALSPREHKQDDMSNGEGPIGQLESVSGLKSEEMSCRVDSSLSPVRTRKAFDPIGSRSPPLPRPKGGPSSLSPIPRPRALRPIKPEESSTRDPPARLVIPDIPTHPKDENEASVPCDPDAITPRGNSPRNGFCFAFEQVDQEVHADSIAVEQKNEAARKDEETATSDDVLSQASLPVTSVADSKLSISPTESVCPKFSPKIETNSTDEVVPVTLTVDGLSRDTPAVCDTMASEAPVKGVFVEISDGQENDSSSDNIPPDVSDEGSTTRDREAVRTREDDCGAEREGNADEILSDDMHGYVSKPSDQIYADQESEKKFERNGFDDSTYLADKEVSYLQDQAADSAELLSVENGDLEVSNRFAAQTTLPLINTKDQTLSRQHIPVDDVGHEDTFCGEQTQGEEAVIATAVLGDVDLGSIEVATSVEDASHMKLGLCQDEGLPDVPASKSEIFSNGQQVVEDLACDNPPSGAVLDDDVSKDLPCDCEDSPAEQMVPPEAFPSTAQTEGVTIDLEKTKTESQDYDAQAAQSHEQLTQCSTEEIRNVGTLWKKNDSDPMSISPIDEAINIQYQSDRDGFVPNQVPIDETRSTAINLAASREASTSGHHDDVVHYESFSEKVGFTLSNSFSPKESFHSDGHLESGDHAMDKVDIFAEPGVCLSKVGQAPYGGDVQPSVRQTNKDSIFDRHTASITSDRFDFPMGTEKYTDPARDVIADEGVQSLSGRLLTNVELAQLRHTAAASSMFDNTSSVANTESAFVAKVNAELASRQMEANEQGEALHTNLLQVPLQEGYENSPTSGTAQNRTSDCDFDSADIGPGSTRGSGEYAHTSPQAQDPAMSPPPLLTQSKPEASDFQTQLLLVPPPPPPQGKKTKKKKKRSRSAKPRSKSTARVKESPNEESKLEFSSDDSEDEDLVNFMESLDADSPLEKNPMNQGDGAGQHGEIPMDHPASSSKAPEIIPTEPDDVLSPTCNSQVPVVENASANASFQSTEPTETLDVQTDGLTVMVPVNDNPQSSTRVDIKTKSSDTETLFGPMEFRGSVEKTRERVISPVSAAKVLHDSRLAEKVDNAISLAAQKLEHQVPDQSHPSVNKPGSIVNLPVPEPDAAHIAPVKLTRSRASPTPWTEVTELSQVNSDTLLKRYMVPEGRPSPFEAIVFLKPKVIGQILDFLGDPVEVCRMKGLNRTCFYYIEENQHKLMQRAVRLGGISMGQRPAFWMWVVLSISQRHAKQRPNPLPPISESDTSLAENWAGEDLVRLQQMGRSGKWNLIIERDVSRSFGNLPPHKTGARLRTDSIVRALVSWGRNRTVKSGVRGNGAPPLPPSRDHSFDSEDDLSQAPTDTVSEWGGVSPSGSFGTMSFSSNKSEQQSKTKSEQNSKNQSKRDRRKRRSDDELALSGNVLTDETKEVLQKKLSFILHALSAAHSEIGYCQGMDYVVAHLLRLLQETVRWHAARGTLPSCVKSIPDSVSLGNMTQSEIADLLIQIDRSLVLEETCFRMMDILLTNYNLGHFYWPELRCLKTCCRVFEKLIQIKLPVLADHFEHHELNVGLFALGWFQTLFLYLPSMPTATVCHMWDIWLVERSFKIFFRVATAILFLSQPILLNHELEGMMSYLNTFPDATLLSPDILIACALQIKVTNRMLMKLEQEVVNESYS